jgi:nucleoid-associated protein YgaU
MTRETKISLLVGLAFIIVIGILLSDHFRSTQELPQAVLADVGATARRATNAPGTANPPINFVAPSETSPNESVPTHEELTRPPSPVIPSPNTSNQPGNDNPRIDNSTPPTEDHGADAPSPDRALANIAARNGEALVPANIDGTNRTDDGMTMSPAPAPAPVPAVAGPRQYRAQEGDTVSRMASRFLGGNTQANRQAIIDANPSLQDDPDRVIVGKAYLIPRSAGASASNGGSTAGTSPATGASEYFYTVKEGDSLWRIANDELGDPSAVEAIKALNETILRGDDHDVVTPGMKLRLPAKPLATTN